MPQHYLRIIVADSDKVNHPTIHPFSIKPDIVGWRIHRYKTSTIKLGKIEILIFQISYGVVFLREVVRSVTKPVRKTCNDENQQNKKISKNAKGTRSRRGHGKQLRFPYGICRPYSHCFQVFE